MDKFFSARNVNGLNFLDTVTPRPSFRPIGLQAGTPGMDQLLLMGDGVALITSEVEGALDDAGRRLDRASKAVERARAAPLIAKAGPAEEAVAEAVAASIQTRRALLVMAAALDAMAARLAAIEAA